MKDNVAGNHPDDASLLAFLDVELDPIERKEIDVHLRTCWSCQSRLRALESEIDAFLEAREWLGAAEGETSPGQVASFERRLIEHQARRAPLLFEAVRIGHLFGSLASRPRRVLPALAAPAVALSFALLVVVLGVVRWPAPLAASNEMVMKTAEAVERARRFEPGKVVHWTVETEVRDGKGEPRRSRLLVWQDNRAPETATIARHHDEDGSLTSANWMRTDGSEVRYNAGEGIEIVPSLAALQEARAGLPADLVAALDSIIARRQPRSSREANRLVFADWFVRYTGIPARGNAEPIETEDCGRVYHVSIDRAYEPAIQGVTRVLIDHYIRVEDYRRCRVHITRFLETGEVETQDSRWSDYRIVPASEFEANLPVELLSGGQPPRQLTPQEMAEAELERMAALYGQAPRAPHGSAGAANGTELRRER